MVSNDEVTDYRNIMQVAVKLLYISRYVAGRAETARPV